MKSGSHPQVVFVTVPPFTQTMLYEQVAVAKIGPIPELLIYGPTEDTPRYHGFVRFMEPLNQPGSHWDSPRQEPPHADLGISLLFTRSKPPPRRDMIKFPIAECSVDIFDESRLYFTADRNTIKVQGQTFNNYTSATDGTRGN